MKTKDELLSLQEENRRLREELAQLQRQSEKPSLRATQQIAMARSIVGLDERIIQLDEQDRIEYVNSGLATLFGFDRKTCIGQHVRTIDQFHWGPGVLQRQIEDARLASSGEIEIEKTFDEPDTGREQIFVIRTAIVNDRAQIILHDVTKERQTQRTFEKMVAPEILDRVMELGKDFSHAERYEMTMLFGDLRGFTKSAQHLAPDEVRNQCNDFLATATEVIHDNHGTVDKYMGDEVMAMFGAPYYYEDHAIKALNAGIEMQLRHRELMKKWAAEGKTSLPLGVGINTGEMVVGLVGSELRADFTVLGHPVNLASRLCSMAGGGDIWLGPGTFDLIKAHVKAHGMDAGIRVSVKFKPAGRIQARGLDEPVDIVNVVLQD